jgi:hypothetical protein
MARPFSSFKDHVLYGLAIGLITPGLLGIVAWYLMQNVTALKQADLLLIACVAVNFLWIKYFFYINKENIGRGIVSATFICAFAFFFYKVMQEI